MRRALRLATAALGAALVLGACSSSSSSTTTSSTAAATSTTAKGQHLTVTPSTGLGSTATVHIAATGYTPGESLVVIECANLSTSTGPADCNLGGLKSVTASSSGAVDTTFSVERGPFGSAHIVCSKPTSCIVSVNPAVANPKQDATAVIAFG